MQEINSFGAYLNELLTLKGIDKKHFAAAMNIKRSMLYRFLSSEQLPDLNQLDEMSQKLNLRTSEQRKLLESYESTQYGWEIVSGRKIITDMLYKLDNKLHKQDLTCAYTIKKWNPAGENTGLVPVTGNSNVVNTVLSLLDSVEQNPAISTVNILLQPDRQDFVNILHQVLAKTMAQQRNLSIKHVIRFKDTLLKRNRLHNLNILSTMLPLSFFEDTYGVYYATEILSSEAYETFFPNFISIDSTTAFVFAADYESGLLYTSPCTQAIELLNKEFSKICADCLPLLINLETYAKQSLYIYEFEHMVQADTSLLHPENGFYTVPVDLIRKKVVELNFPKEFAQILIQRIKIFRERLKTSKALEIVSMPGLLNFAKTGRLLIYREIQLNINERIQIFKNLLAFVQGEKNYSLYLMKEGNPFYDCDFAVYVIGSELLYIVPSYTDFKVSDNLIIRNKGIVESFADFLHSSFTTQNSIIHQDEVAAVLLNIISDLTAQLSLNDA